MISKPIAFASILASASAFSTVTIRQLPTGCEYYPTYYPWTDSTAPLQLVAFDAENTAIEGVGMTPRFSLDANKNLRWGNVATCFTNQQARGSFYCQKDTIFVQTSAFNSTIKPDQFGYTPATLSPDASDATIRFFTEGSAQVGLFEHYNGTAKLDGYFWGGYNTTTWGVQWQDGEASTRFTPTYYLRLLPEGQDLKANETRAYMKLSW